jgi:hypothetical protein
VLEVRREWSVKRVWKCNLLEDRLDDDGSGEVAVESLGDGSTRVPVVLRAWEVASFRLLL